MDQDPAAPAAGQEGRPVSTTMSKDRHSTAGSSSTERRIIDSPPRLTRELLSPLPINMTTYASAAFAQYAESELQGLQALYDDQMQKVTEFYSEHQQLQSQSKHLESRRTAQGSSEDLNRRASILSDWRQGLTLRGLPDGTYVASAAQKTSDRLYAKSQDLGIDEVAALLYYQRIVEMADSLSQREATLRGQQ